MAFERATLVALAVTTVSLLSIQLVGADLPYDITIESTSYTLRAEFATRSPKGELNAFKLEEFHSDWQRRSRVDYRIEGPAARLLSRRGSLFASEKQVFMIDHEPFLNYQKKCTRIERVEVDRAFQLDQIAEGLLGEPRADYEVGTTRLLLGLARNSQSFKPQVVGKVNFVQDLLSKNVFEAKIGEFSIMVLYLSATSLPLGLPSEVLIESDNGFTMLVKYKQVTVLAHNELLLGDSSLPAVRKGGNIRGDANEILFDALAIDRNFDCPISSKSQADENGGRQTTADPIESALRETALKYRFSFEAQVESENLGPSNRMTVMYEPHLDTLRVDQLFENRATHTLVSFPHDRSYHVLRRLGEASDPVLDSVLQTDGESDDVTCVVSKVSLENDPKDSYKNPHSLGSMLLGAARSAIYLGLAQVRGIEAHAFMANNGQLPVWLEQPVVYSMTGELGRYHLRTSSICDTYPLEITTIFYFARDDENDPSGENMILGNRLLHIEIFKRTKLRFPRGSFNISIYDFSWQLRGETPASGGERTEDFLSLSDYCLAPSSEDNHYARIHFALRAAPDQAKANAELASVNWLEVPTRRNLAVLRAMREQLRVPPTLVFDVESRHTKANLASRESVFVSMLAAQRYEAPVALTYLRSAKNIVSSSVSRFHTVAVSGFQECLWLAAHKREARTVFAYFAFGFRCHIHEGESEGVVDSLESMFDRHNGALEVFEVAHWANRKLAHDDDVIAKLEDLHEHLNKFPRLVLENPEVADRKLFFSIESAQVDHLNEKIAYDLDEHHLDDTNKFVGLGLVPSDKQNKLIEPRWVLEPAGTETGTGSGNEVTRHQVSMTYEQCQEACLLDIECRAYSTCLVRGQLECTLTSVDFAISTVVLELMELQERAAKLGESFPVTLGGAGELIHVKKHPGCELHNKLYKRLFRDSGKFAVSLRGRSLHPATHSEQCAEICFQTTLDTMRNETRRLQSMSEEKLTKDSGALVEYEATHCAAYLYLDKQQVADEQLTIAADQIVGKNTDGATRGYCLLEQGKDSSASRGQQVELRKFELDFSVFYEKRYGVSLVPSEKSTEEKEAFHKIVHRRDLSPVDLTRVGAFLNRLGNTATLMNLNPGQSARDCARECFTQTSSTWPACRSFELIEVTHRITAARRSVCIFNSLTMGQVQAASRTDMILQENRQNWVRTREGDEVQVWHFEPRDGLVATSLEQVYRVARVEPATGLLSRAQKLYSMNLQLNANGSKLLACLGGLGAKRGEDREVLVNENSLSRVTFEDAVRAEQLAPPGGENENLKSMLNPPAVFL